MAQLGHTDPAFTIRVYPHLMRRPPEEREALKALIEGAIVAPSGTSTLQPATAEPLPVTATKRGNGTAKR